MVLTLYLSATVYTQGPDLMHTYVTWNHDHGYALTHAQNALTMTSAVGQPPKYHTAPLPIHYQVAHIAQQNGANNL